jgi:hypothetical protein
MAGALGAELCARFLELGWITRRGPGRAVVMTDEGSGKLRSLLGLDLEPAG